MKKTDLFTILAPAIIMISGCSEKIEPGKQAVERPSVTGVVVEEVRARDEVDYYEATGTVAARNTSRVSAKIMGEVKDIHVFPGSRVRSGDVLLEIHSPDSTSRVRAAEEARGEAEEGLKMAEEGRTLMAKTYERYLGLHEARAVTDQEFDEIKTGRTIADLRYEQSLRSLKKAEAALKEAEALRDYTMIRSPVEGVIAEKNIDRGSMTAPGMTLFVIEEAAYRVEVPVDEGLLSEVTLNMPAEISVPALNLSTRGKVGEIVPQVDPRSRTFPVKVDLPEGVQSLRGGFFALVKFPVGKKSRLFVHEDAILSRGELRGVYVVDAEGVITFRLVRTGKIAGTMTEILSGLNSGEKIIVKGAEGAVDGGRVSGG
jgi:RND family efflux transporter MFP subunit